MPRRPPKALRRDRAADLAGRSGPTGADDERGLSAGWQQQVRTREGDFLVGTVPGQLARKVYRCPGCNQEIAVGTAHVVVWPADDHLSVADRRHWHRACWQRRSTRGGPGRLPW